MRLLNRDCRQPLRQRTRRLRNGYDAHKKISSRKRYIAVDTDGRLLAVNLTSTNIADSTGAQLVLDALVKRRP